jgi:indolepyruvate ferredoxin oxidoreductase, beta subunit
MKCDIILAGVGGQGVLTISSIIAAGALKEGLQVKQSEVHGMSQRGGAVQSNLRLGTEPIHSDIVPLGSADMILSMEPLESLRYLQFLAPTGFVLTATEPVENIPDYPDVDEILAKVRCLPKARTFGATKLARQAGSARASNVVIVGAASHLLPIKPATLEACIRETFARKGDKVVEINLKAFHIGREAIQWEPE